MERSRQALWPGITVQKAARPVLDGFSAAIGTNLQEKIAFLRRIW